MMSISNCSRTSSMNQLYWFINKKQDPGKISYNSKKYLDIIWDYIKNSIII